MRKKSLLIPLALLLAMSLVAAGCQAPAPAPAPVPAPAPAPAWEWPESLRLASPGVGTANYAMMIAWGAVLEQTTGMRIRVIPESSSIVRHRWLKQEMVQIQMHSIQEAANGIMGVLGYQARDSGPLQMRAFWQSYICPWGFVVRGDSDIETIYDIKPETKIGIVPGFALTVRSVDALLALLEREATIVPTASHVASIRALGEGKVDVILTSPTTGVVYELEASPHGIRWLPLPTMAEDPEAVKRWLSMSPVDVFSPATLGVESARGLNMIAGGQMYVVRADISTELIYHLTKWFDENYDAYKDKHILLPEMKIDIVKAGMEPIFLPVHEGAVRYFKEKGMWTADDDARQEENMKLVTRYVEGYEAAIDMADQRKIKVDPMNEEWVQLWENYKKDVNLQPILMMR